MLGACAASAPAETSAQHDGITKVTGPATARDLGPSRDQEPTPAASPRDAGPVAPPEASLGLADQGIFPDLDGRVQLDLPSDLASHAVSATIDTTHAVLVVEVDGWPTKAYPLGGDAELRLGAVVLSLRPGDRAELAPVLRAEAVRTLNADDTRTDDRDRDGIPDTLDVLIGAHKTVLNADAYEGGYVSLPYPGGDVPRAIGVCTDVIIRALRNAGLDLQLEVHRDIGRAPRSYPMVKGKGDASIDHRRVKTILPYFRRHFREHGVRADDPDDPLRPGDVVFMDTFPSKPGPDHIGILSDHRDADGLPLVINNWTDGTVTAEMDLLGWVPVTHRFRFP